MKLIRLIPPPITAVFLIIAAKMMSSSIPGSKIILVRSEFFALLITTLGVVLMLWSFILFRKLRTTLNPNKTPDKIITEGPYRISRNPMYLGLVLCMLGFSLWQGELFLFFATVLFFFLMDRIVIPYEEKLAQEGMKSLYLAYAKSVRRWI